MLEKESEHRDAVEVVSQGAAHDIGTAILQQLGDTVLQDDNFEPTEHDVKEYAEWLGMDMENEKELLWIVKEALEAPLSEHWKPCQKADSDDIYYLNSNTGAVSWEHPCDVHYKNLYQRHKLELEETRQQHAAAVTIQCIARSRMAMQKAHNIFTQLTVEELQYKHSIKAVLGGVVNMSGMVLDDAAVCNLCNFIRSVDSSSVTFLYFRGCELGVLSLHQLASALSRFVTYKLFTLFACIDFAFLPAVISAGSSASTCVEMLQ